MQPGEQGSSYVRPYKRAPQKTQNPPREASTGRNAEGLEVLR